MLSLQDKIITIADHLTEAGDTTNHKVKPQDRKQEHALGRDYATYYVYGNKVGIRIFHELTLNKNLHFDTIPHTMGPEKIVRDVSSNLFYIIMQPGDQEMLMGNLSFDEGKWGRTEKGSKGLRAYRQGKDILVSDPSGDPNKHIQKIHPLRIPTKKELEFILTELHRALL